jgi:hypothetical protein
MVIILFQIWIKKILIKILFIYKTQVMIYIYIYTYA